MKSATTFDLSCVVHVHSTYSDGTATVSEIIEAARAADRDAVLLTDHDSLAAKREGWEGWHDGVLLLVGTEVSPRQGHYLAFGLDDEIDHERVGEHRLAKAVRDAGGFGFAAHPFSEGSKMSKLIGRPHPWRHLRDPALTGIELWSLATDAAESWPNPLEAVRCLRDPDGSIAGPPPGNLENWDSLLAERPTVAIGGLDAHQSGVRFRGRAYSPMPNSEWFRLLGTHVLLEQPPSRNVKEDRAAVYSALRAGRCYLSRDSLGDPRGLDFWAESSSERVEMGRTASGNGWTLRLELPQVADIQLVRDGVPVSATWGQGLTRKVDAPGVYRASAKIPTARGPRTWILTNAIRIREAA